MAGDREHRLVKPGRWEGHGAKDGRQRIVSTVSLNRDDTDGAEGTAGAEGMGTTLEGCEHRLIKPGRHRIRGTDLKRDDKWVERRILIEDWIE
ncbi:hypothetical protein K440DRAFT_635075 [Wilcoxina mikolae CBS 423.85]|nr:hypothetical protein K440DRAFT_635075 [Wilcoxina mikolae CBS 423.85]